MLFNASNRECFVVLRIREWICSTTSKVRLTIVTICRWSRMRYKFLLCFHFFVVVLHCFQLLWCKQWTSQGKWKQNKKKNNINKTKKAERKWKNDDNVVHFTPWHHYRQIKNKKKKYVLRCMPNRFGNNNE